MKWILANFVILISSCSGDSLEFDVLRKNMIETQIKQRGIKNELVLNAMLEVKRHNFVPEEYRKLAYTDSPLPIGNEQTISQPYIVGFMTEKLQVENYHNVLEIGTGSGYQAAVLSKISSHVYSIEIISNLAQNAKRVLKENNYNNITIKIGDGYKGWVEHAPFDRIIVTAAPDKIPQELIDQLKPGGKMIIPVGQRYMTQYIWLITKQNNGSIYKEKILPVRFVPMVKE